MKPIKYVWYIVVAVLCFFLLLGIGVYCLKKWGAPVQYQGGVLVKHEQPLQDESPAEDSASIEAIVRMEAIRAIRTAEDAITDADRTTADRTTADRITDTAAAGEDRV
ncbi:MAG: hypothetical protein Q4E24_04560 [bacterium]|nr:hypothetical protein [bacterium]